MYSPCAFFLCSAFFFLFSLSLCLLSYPPLSIIFPIIPLSSFVSLTLVADLIWLRHRGMETSGMIESSNDQLNLWGCLESCNRLGTGRVSQCWSIGMRNPLGSEKSTLWSFLANPSGCENQQISPLGCENLKNVTKSLIWPSEFEIQTYPAFFLSC